MRTSELVLASLALLGVSSFGLAQEQSQQAEEGEVIVVTGSRIARDAAIDASTPLAVISSEDIKLSGSVNVDKILGDSPQFVQATNGGATANQVPAGSAAGASYTNLRGFGPTRSLTLVNGRRFAIFGPELVTDLNTIPTALIERTEVVTGGSSAVYGSDAITGVVNFIMKQDFEGVQVGGQYGFDSNTSTPTYSADLTLGGNFGEGRGNAVVSLNYYKRDGFTRGDVGSWSEIPYGEACVTADTWSDSLIGTANGSNAANCAASGGKMGFIFVGSGDIPNGRFFLSDAQRAAAATQIGAAGLGGMTAVGFTFDDAGSQQRLAVRPADDFNNTFFNYLQVPQERWMINAFTHYEFAPQATGYLEAHFSNNRVDQQLTQSNIGGEFLFNVNNPYLPDNDGNPATESPMQALLRQLDASETGPRTLQQGSTAFTTTQNDGLAILNTGRRFVEFPYRHNIDDHNVWRVALGMRGELGDVSDKFLRNLNYDVYYTFARSEDSSRQEGAASRSRYQASLLRVGGADPVANIFGQNLSAAAVAAFSINSTNVTNAEQKGIVATIGGDIVDLPAGPLGFSLGVESRKSSAEYIPDQFLRSGDVVGFNPGLPTAGEISVKEYFGEVRVPVLGNIPGVENLSLNGGFRSSDYDLDGVGRVSTYLYGLDWRIVDSVALRAQFQRAIRAPNIGDLYGGSALNVPNGINDPCSNRNTTQQTAAVTALCIATGVPPTAVYSGAPLSDQLIPSLSGGNPDLQEESSDTRTFGVVFTPTFLPGLAVTLDYWDISLDGAIDQLGGGTQGTLNLCYYVVQDINSEFCQAVHRNPASGAIAIPYSLDVRQANTGGRETKGIDLAGRYGFDIGKSRLDINTAWTYVDEFTITPVQALPENTNECVGAYGTVCGEPIPQYKGVTRFTWRTGPFSVSLRHRFIDSVTTDRIVLPKTGGRPVPLANTLTNPKLDAYNYLDLSATWNIADKAEVFIGANNVLDKDPPIVAGFGGYGNTFPATYDYQGISFFVGVNVKSF